MADINPILLIAVMSGVLLAVLFVVGLIPMLVSRRWNKHRAQTVSKWEAEGVTFRRGPVGGQFGGLESMGVSRVVRGIGFVALTDKDLRVTRATAPAAEWRIPLKKMKSVTIQPAFMGHRGKSPFIVVRFVKDGKKDRLGFQVGEFEAWANDVAREAGLAVKNELDHEGGSA